MRPKKSISYQELINLVPEQLLDDLAIKTNVDYSVSKLTGKNMFSLLLYGLTSEKSVSLRILEDVFKSPVLWASHQKEPVRYSAISQRLKNMSAQYFQKIFEYLAKSEQIDKLLGLVGSKYIVKKIDSTIVNLSAELLHLGLKINQEKRDLKFSLGLINGLPANIELFTEQTFASENKALPKIIKKKNSPKNQDKLTIMLFDRGAHKIDTYDEINKIKNNYFITRLSSQSYQVKRIYKNIKGRSSGDLILEKDEVIVFNGKNRKNKKQFEYRLVTAINPKNDRQLKFLTNIYFLNASEISMLYKQRWEIETFFKFIKQQLNFSHLVSRSRNGIKIMMYMTMIVAILIAIYKKINKIESWVIAKMRFVREMEMNVIETFFEVLAPLWGYSKNISVPINDS